MMSTESTSYLPEGINQDIEMNKPIRGGTDARDETQTHINEEPVGARSEI